jgi:hypothetical protein
MEHDRRITQLLQRVINVMDKQQWCMHTDMANDSGTSYIYEYIMKRIKDLELFCPENRQDSQHTMAFISINNLPIKYQQVIRQRYPKITNDITGLTIRIVKFNGIKIEITVSYSFAQYYMLPDVKTIEETVNFMNAIFPEA